MAVLITLFFVKNFSLLMIEIAWYFLIYCSDSIEPNSKRFKPYGPASSSSSSESSSSFLSSEEDEKCRKALLHCNTGTSESNLHNATTTMQQRPRESGFVRKDASEKSSQGFTASVANHLSSVKSKISGDSAATFAPTQDNSVAKLKQSELWIFC